MKHSAESSAASREGIPKDPNSTSVLDDIPEFTRYRPGGVFLVITGSDRGEQVVLSDKPITIGSSPSCELVLSDRTVSRRHATAQLENNQVVVRDLGSTNGSFTYGAVSYTHLDVYKRQAQAIARQKASAAAS